jgi:hypothetical protein
MRSTILTAVFLATACSSCRDEVPRPEPGGGSGALLDGGAPLAGRAIEAAEEGPWRLRRTAGSGGGRGAARGRDAESEELFAFAADSRAPGEAVEELRDGAPAGAAPAASGGPPSPAPGLSPGSAGSAPLRAGSTDDNAAFEAFLTYLDEKEQRRELDALWQPLDVRGRTSIRVVDAAGVPMPGLRLRVVDEGADRIVWRGTTQGDGRVPFYPALARAGGAAFDTVLVEVEHGGGSFRQHWNLAGECVVALPGAAAQAEAEIALDVVFVIDTTGSMGDEIDRIKATLLGVTEQLKALDREFTLRYGAVLYRDVGDAYVTCEHGFTADLEAFAAALQKIEASGGGDGPESLNQGLAVAVEHLEWRERAARLAFLIADAPPHMDYENDVPYGASVEAAIGAGIRIHTVAASGLDEVGSLVFRQIAQATRGEFVFIEYGGDVTASGEAHGVGGVRKANNLDDILFAKIRDEIATWGRDV